MTPSSSSIRFPAMRDEVVYALAALSNPEYQLEVWIDRIVPHDGYEYDFDMACHAILDDTALLSDPASMVGDVLRNVSELDALLALAWQLLLVIKEIGRKGDFPKARNSSRWKSVVNAAIYATDILGRPVSFP